MVPTCAGRGRSGSRRGGLKAWPSARRRRAPQSALPADAILAPGFIDIQVNGGGGVLLNDQPTEAGVRRIVEAHRKEGTTGCLPTLITDRSEVIERLAAVAQACLQDSRRSRLSSGRAGPQQVSQGHSSGGRDTRAGSARSRRHQKFWGPRPLHCDLGAGMRARVHDR